MSKPISKGTLNKAMINAEFDDDDEDETNTSRIQQLEIGMNGMRQQLSSIASILTDLQTQMSSRKQSGSETSSITSSLSGSESSLFDTKLICFVSGSVQQWLPVYKKHSHMVGMYTYRELELKTLSSAQIRSLKKADGSPYISGSS